MLTAPERRDLSVWREMPAALRRPRASRWSRLNLANRDIGCFLEGPDFDAAGNLYLVDIPFGRVLRIDRDGHWSVVAEYEGWPNGLKVMPDGTVLVADHELGLLRLEPGCGRHTTLLADVAGQPLLGLNDLTLGCDGTIYVTDQGQSGLHDPRGRVIRVGPDRTAEVLLANCPSPNGLVFDRTMPWLYVAMTRGNCVWRVPLVDGTPTKVGLAVQLSGGIGPDGLALDQYGRLLVVQAPFGVWQLDSNNVPLRFYAAPEPAYVTNLVVRRQDDVSRIYVTNSVAGRVLVADLPEEP